MINNELKGLNRLLLLAHAYGRFTAESEEPETRTYTYRSVPICCTVVYQLICSLPIMTKTRIMLELYIYKLLSI